MKKNRLLFFLNIMAAGMMAAMFCSCQDDGLGFSAEDLRDGETVVSLEAAFSPFSEGNLTRASQTPPGRGFNELTDLVVLVYDEEGNLLDGEDGMHEIKFNPEDVKNEDRVNGDASNGTTAEPDTKSLKNISLRLPFGCYYIVGVANLGNTVNGTTTTTLSRLKGEFADECKTLDGLRKIKVQWSGDNYRNNREMLGYFTDPEASAPKATSSFPTVSINRPGIKLRAWLRRCASKITIDFDGRGLREGIYIYIKDARIYDIPNECTLGFGEEGVESSKVIYNNTVTDEKSLTNREVSGHWIDYRIKQSADLATDKDYSGWPCITKGTPYIMDGEEKKDFHTQDAPALYFYENMQGEGENRTPVPDMSSSGVANDNKKDGKPYGTYIEVTAHYHSDADGNIADYDIKYRFMIGKNVTTNFDAERNYHYKLTLKFRGNANEYHWHIDYDEVEGFDFPNPWYISYLYDHETDFPFKYTPPKGYELIGLKADIVTNPWFPTQVAEEKLNDTSVDITPITPIGDQGHAGDNPYEHSANKDNGNGFLSFRSINNNGVITDMDAKGDTWNKLGSYNELALATINSDYYLGKGNAKNKINLSTRVFMENGSIIDDSNNDRENFSYMQDGENYSFKIPLFTRAKIMVKQTGYTGNNPFVGYQRIGRIKLTATIRNKDTKKEETRYDQVNVVQVRRVVNPKGVYRSEGNNQPFHVVLMHLTSDASDGVFKPIISRGPWAAQIIGDKNFITLDGKQQVSGSTNTNIDFQIKFNRLGKGNKNAVIRITYHNHSCVHLIFVRRGYAPQAISPTARQTVGSAEGDATSAVWSAFNMISEDVEANDPRDEGSLFKFGNYTDPIDASNNAYKIGGNEVYYELGMEDFTPPGKLEIAGGTSKNWSDIKPNKDGFSTSTKKIKNAATINDFEQLYRTNNVKFGYGVLYADGATETQTTVDMAYGWKRGGNNAKGMRGLFIYYWDGKLENGDSFNGRNMFFPIGRSGYGHRKNAKEDYDQNTAYGQNNNGKGILRYSCSRCMPTNLYKWNWNHSGEVNTYKNFTQIAPLFVYLYRRPGAIYYARNIVEDKKYLPWNGVMNDTEGDGYGLDINYFTFDVNAISGSNVDSGNDACFVRCVE